MARVAITVFGVATLLFLPVDFFDHGPVVCLSRLLFDVECWGCGITRASMHLIHGEFLEAYDFNKLVIVVVPIMAAGLLNDRIKDIRLIINDLKAN